MADEGFITRRGRRSRQGEADRRRRRSHRRRQRRALLPRRGPQVSRSEVRRQGALRERPDREDRRSTSGCSRPRTRPSIAACAASTSAAASASRAATSSPKARRSMPSRSIAGRAASSKATSCPPSSAASTTRPRACASASSSADLTRAGMQWTNKKSPKDILKAGDLIDVEITKIDGKTATVTLEQTPLIEGALVAIDNHTGEVLAMVGGYSFSRSKFNRATQAYPADGLDGEADPLHRGDRSRPDADDDPGRRADDVRRRRRAAAVLAAQLRSQVHGAADAAARARAVAQHPVGEGHRDARADAGRGLREEVRLRAGLPPVPVDGARRAGSDADGNHERVLRVPESRHPHGAVSARKRSTIATARCSRSGGRSRRTRFAPTPRTC